MKVRERLLVGLATGITAAAVSVGGTGCVYAPLANSDIHNGEGRVQVAINDTFPDPDHPGQRLANLQVLDEHVQPLRQTMAELFRPLPHATLRLRPTENDFWRTGNVCQEGDAACLFFGSPHPLVGV